MATTALTPAGRDFHSSLGYFHSQNDYFTQRRHEGCGNKDHIDLWDTDHPAIGLNGTGPEHGFEEGLFMERAVQKILSHDVTAPMFLYYALHTSCVGPNGLQAPPSWYKYFAFINSTDRRKNHAMGELKCSSYASHHS
jgi:arylsulfatase I/J